MRELMRCAKLASKSAIKPLWFLIAIAVLFEPDAALTQAGSTGGNVGKQDKSVSGAQDEGAKPPRAQKTSPKPSRSAPARAETGASAASGEWKGVSTGRCIVDWSWTLQISGEGIITGSGTTGRVGRGGAGNGTMRVLGKNYHFAGHFGPSRGSGTWKREDGCSGKWTGTKS
ncbi:MAG: hypothetical protein WBG10_01655 [Pseudolabrys sp.]